MNHAYDEDRAESGMAEQIGETDRFPWFEVTLIGGFFAMFITPVLLIFGTYFLFSFFGLIYPGVRIGEVAVSGLTQQAAMHKLNQVWSGQDTLIVTDGVREWLASPEDFGLQVVPDAAIEQAFAIGRGPSGMLEFLTALTGRKQTVEPEVLFTPESALSKLEQLAPAVEIIGRPAGVTYQDGAWQIVPAQDGLSLDIHATLQSLALDPTRAVSEGRLKLSMVVHEFNPESGDVLIEEVLAQVNKPLRISAYDPIDDRLVEWTITPQELAPLIQIMPADDNGTMQAQLVGERFLSMLNAQLPEQSPNWMPDPALNLETLTADWQAQHPFEMTPWHKPQNYVVQPGDSLVGIGLENGIPYWKIQEANPFLIEQGLQPGQVLVIPSKNELLPLPVVHGKRIVISIGEQRMRTWQNGNLQQEYLISTGIDSSPTHPGIFQVQTHEMEAYASVWDLYMPHFLGIYEGWPGFMNGIHGLPTLSSGQRLWANVLGRKASYGCIILSLENAESLYNWAENGVIVEITP